MQDAGARRVSNAEGIRIIVRKHDCALPTLYPKHSNSWGAIFRDGSVESSLSLSLGVCLNLGLAYFGGLI